MSHFELSRRRFLSSLGLTTGAAVMSPIASRLYGEAWGQTMPAAKRIVFLSMGAGLPDLQLGWPQRTDERTWDFHPALAPLAPWKNRMLILRNMSLGLGAMQHSGGFGLGAGLGSGAGETTTTPPPAGQTIDQYLAERIGKDSAFRSVLFGIDSNPNAVMGESLFATGKDAPLPYPVRASRLFESLFPSATAGQARAIADRRVLARVQGDADRLRGKLAGEERAKLDGYLASLEAFDRRRNNTQCLAPGAPSAERGAVKEFPVMLDMAAVALRCGMTNVVGGTVGGGNSHYHFPALVGPHIGTRFEAQGYVGDHGHDGDDKYRDARTVGFTWFSTVVADFLRQLELPGPNGRSVLDDTTVVLYSDCGANHHNLEAGNWRFIVIGNAGGALKTDGRYMTFTPDVYWEPVRPGTRSVNSLWCTLAHAMGAPTDAFGAGGSRTNGPMPELLT